MGILHTAGVGHRPQCIYEPPANRFFLVLNGCAARAVVRNSIELLQHLGSDSLFLGRHPQKALRLAAQHKATIQQILETLIQIFFNAQILIDLPPVDGRCLLDGLFCLGCCQVVRLCLQAGHQLGNRLAADHLVGKAAAHLQVGAQQHDFFLVVAQRCCDNTAVFDCVPLCVAARLQIIQCLIAALAGEQNVLRLFAIRPRIYDQIVHQAVAVNVVGQCFHILVGVQLAENRIVRVQLDVLQGNFPQLIGKLGAVLRGQVGNQAAGGVVVSGAENRLGGRNAHLDLGSAGLLFHSHLTFPPIPPGAFSAPHTPPHSFWPGAACGPSSRPARSG